MYLGLKGREHSLFRYLFVKCKLFAGHWIVDKMCLKLAISPLYIYKWSPRVHICMTDYSKHVVADVFSQSLYCVFLLKKPIQEGATIHREGIIEILFFLFLDRELKKYLNGNKDFEQKKQINKRKEKELDAFSWKKEAKCKGIQLHQSGMNIHVNKVIIKWNMLNSWSYPSFLLFCLTITKEDFKVTLKKGSLAFLLKYYKGRFQGHVEKWKSCFFA